MKYEIFKCSHADEVIDKIKGKPGVWFLLGKEEEKANSPFVCLQVAQKDNIGEEIKTDVQYMQASELKPLIEEKSYVNQFGEEKFTYEEWGQWRARNLYYYIDHNYKELTFIAIWDEESFTEKTNRELLEKYIAYKTKAEFWVNGRAFKKGQTEKVKESLLSKYSSSCADIQKKLITMIGEANVNTINEIIDNIKN